MTKRGYDLGWVLVAGTLAVSPLCCGGEAVIDPAGGGGSGAGSTSSTSNSTTTSTTTTSGTTTVPTASCNALATFCACWAAEQCWPVGAGCLCHCDYECPGEPPCDCGCGGGDYLGCSPTDCPQHEFEPGTEVVFGPDGCAQPVE